MMRTFSASLFVRHSNVDRDRETRAGGILDFWVIKGTVALLVIVRRGGSFFEDK